MNSLRVGILGSNVPMHWLAPGETTVVIDSDLPAHDHVDVLIADGTDPSVITRVRHLKSRLPHMQPIILAAGEHWHRVQREVTLTPGLGEIWIRAPQQLDHDTVSRAAQIGAQRRRYAAATKATAAKQVREAPPPRRPVVTDAMLATILQVARVAVFALDSDGRILAANPAAERLFNVSERETVGKRLADIAGDRNREAVITALNTPGKHPHLEIVDAAGAVHILEVDVREIPDRAQPIVVLVAHDITEAVHQQEKMESQAVELEYQAVQLEESLHAREQALAEIERLMEARSRFYAAMNHEIRTPINAILGFNDLLLAGVYGKLSAEQLNGIERSQRAARHLLELVNDVLDLSKIEAGRVDLEIAECRLDQLIRDLMQTLEPTMLEAGSKIVCDLECDEPISTDPRRVRQILMNLVSNAAKFGNRKPITIRCTRDGDNARIDVVDRGIGISPEELPRIFDEFVQLRERREKGTGLGLPISKRLASLLGGRVEVQSELGAGSTFSLILPVSARRSA